MLRDDSPLIGYLPQDQMDLIKQGYYVLEFILEDREKKFEDYSFVVFPFAKAYEGFLKKIFLDAGYITREDYLSKHFRIGRVMSPHLKHKLRKESVYGKICESVGCELSEEIWNTWTFARNQVFHFFPENVRSLTLQEAQDLIEALILNMEHVVMEVQIQNVRTRLSRLSEAEVKKLKSEKKTLEVV